MKKILLFMVVLTLVFSVFAIAEPVPENKLVTELKQWDWSLGGMTYLKNADEFYYSAGVQRDLAPFFNWLPEERLYGKIGYLNTTVLGTDNVAPGDKDYFDAGLSTNANFLAQCVVSGLNELLNSNFETPEALNRILATIGIVGAKKIDSDFWNVGRGYDYGANISIIKEW